MKALEFRKTTTGAVVGIVTEEKKSSWEQNKALYSL